MKCLFDFVCTSTEMPWIRRLSAMRKSWRWVPVFSGHRMGGKQWKYNRATCFLYFFRKRPSFHVNPSWSSCHVQTKNPLLRTVIIRWVVCVLRHIMFYYYKSKWYSWIWVNVKNMYIFLYLYISKSLKNAISQIRSFFQSLPGFEETIAWSPAGQFSVPRLNLIEKF